MSNILSSTGHVRGLVHAAAVSRLDSGQDAVTPSGMRPGLDVYCGYDAGAPGYRNGSYSNMAAIKSLFPGKRYISVGRDAIDVEPGLASAADAPGFVLGWTPVNTNRPLVYANGSTMPDVQSALNGAGIARDRYYLWVALWDGSPSIPAGFDGKQYASTPGYDADSFNDYVFGPAVPVNPYPDLALGATGPAVTTLQNRLNAWGAAHPFLKADRIYGPATEAAVRAFEGARNLPVDGKIDADDWRVLKTVPPVAPKPRPKGTYGPPTSLKAGALNHQVEVPLTWAQPALEAGQPKASEYTVYVYKNLADKAHVVPGFPVTIPVPDLTVQLDAGAKYIVHVVAAGLNGSGVAPGVFAALELSL